VTYRKSHGGKWKSQPARAARGSEYTAWQNAIQRCEDPNNKSYPRYGGRGISFCPKWRTNFEAFLADIGARPSPKHTLDRYPDVNGNYEPGNVRWATQQEQQRNRSNNRMLEAFGRSRCVAEWADELGLPAHVIHLRLRRGWTVELALSTPLLEPVRYLFGGKSVLFSEMVAITGIPSTSLYRLLKRFDGNADMAHAYWRDNKNQRANGQE
jgi:hypothetical protein